MRIYSAMRNFFYVHSKSITVLSQYKAQCAEIKTNLEDIGMDHPQVSTIVASQGMWNVVSGYAAKQINNINIIVWEWDQ